MPQEHNLDVEHAEMLLQGLKMAFQEGHRYMEFMELKRLAKMRLAREELRKRSGSIAKAKQFLA